MTRRGLKRIKVYAILDAGEINEHRFQAQKSREEREVNILFFRMKYMNSS
jgi:hypothetical protein